MSIEQFDDYEPMLEQIIDATATGYEAAVRSHMPDCLYHDFCLWGMSRHNPNRLAFMEQIGALQISKLTAGLLVGLTEGEASWQGLLRASMTINAWLTLEVQSDDLAIGLARHKTGDHESDATRRALLHTFNTLMAERLKDNISAAVARDALSNSCSDGILLFHQYLAPLKYRSLAEIFINEKGGALHEIEHAEQPGLIANIEACVDVANAIEIERLRPLVRNSLIARYEGINKLLEPDERSLEELLDVGAYTILVIPTLGYHISALTQYSGIESRLEQLIDEGTLADALYGATLLVRLLNDIGAGLLTFDDSTRLMFLHELEERGREQAGESLVELLVRIGGEYTPLNRIRKDVCLGEFNVCLSGIGRDPFSREELWALGQRLALCAKAYSVHKAKLASELQKLSAGLKDDRVSQIILRFVRFYERFYDGHYHDTVDGDYATY